MSHRHGPPPSIKCLQPPPPPAGDPLEPYYCRCGHPHHPDAYWCYACENPLPPRSAVTRITP